MAKKHLEMVNSSKKEIYIKRTNKNLKKVLNAEGRCGESAAPGGPGMENLHISPPGKMKVQLTFLSRVIHSPWGLVTHSNL